MVKVFLSYGRGDTQPLAERLHADLNAAGFTVWQDLEQIRVGWGWDGEIEQGIRTSDVVVLLLSPHAVRRRGLPGSTSDTDSVCLDEIAFARGENVPIVPAMTIPCVPPLLVYRVQQVDLTQWEDFDERYSRAVTRLTGAIEAAARGEAAERAFVDLPMPRDSEPFLASRRRRFTGREWLFDAIDAWRHRERLPLLLITGGPGSGKSALVAQLVMTNPDEQVLAYHCCQWDIPESLEPGRLVQSLAAMLAGRIEAYAAALADPRLREVLDDENVARDPGSAFENGVLAPLHSIPKPVDATSYLLIDALDESLLYEGSPGIFDVLASRLDRLPAWLRVVATARPTSTIRARLRGLGHAEIEATDPRNVDDVHSYALARLRETSLAEICVTSNKSADELATLALGVLSEGEHQGVNFLFTVTALDALEAGQISWQQLAELPPRMEGLYLIFFDRLFGTVDFEPSRHVLSVIVAAREPLNRKQLAEITGLHLDDELTPCLKRLEAFLPPARGTYAFFHGSLAEWLTGWDSEFDEAKAGRYHSPAEKGHECLADWIWDRFEKDPHGLPDYALRHLPAHLAAMNQWENLAAALTSMAFLESKCGKLGVYTLAWDVKAVVQAEPTLRVRLQPVLRTLDREAHNLRRWDAEKDPVYFAQQIHNRAITQNAYNVTTVAAARLSELALPTLRLRWRGSLESADLERTLTGHTGDVNTVCVTRDGQFVLSGSEDRTVRLWDIESGEPLATLEGHEAKVLSVDVTPDGRRGVSGSEDKTIRVWNLLAKRQTAVLTGHEGPVSSVHVLPDGERLVSHSEDGTLRLWDIPRGIELDRLGSAEHEVRVSGISPDGWYAIAGLADGGVQVWDLRSRAIRTLPGHSGGVRAVSASHAAERVASVGGDNQLVLWEPGTSTAVSTIPLGSVQLGSLALSRDGRYAVGVVGATRVVAFDLEQETGVIFDGHTFPVRDAVFVAQDRTVITCSMDNTLRLWDVETGAQIQTLFGHASIVSSVAVTTDGARAISGGLDRSLKVWHLAESTNKRVREQPSSEREPGGPEAVGHTGDVRSVVVSPDQALVASASTDGTVIVWEVESGDSLHLLRGHEGCVTTVVITPDGERLISASVDECLKVWDLRTGEEIWSLEGHSARVDCLAVSSSGRRVVSASNDGTLRVWDLDAGVELWRVEVYVTALDLTSDGRIVASTAVSCQDSGAEASDRESRLEVFEMETGQRTWELRGHRKESFSLATAADGRCAVTGSDDETAIIWDLDRGARLYTLEGHRCWVRHVAFAADGRRVVSAGDASILRMGADETSPPIDADHALRVWEVRTGQLVATLHGHTDRVGALRALSCGRRMVSVSDDGQLIVWDLDLAKAIAHTTLDGRIEALGASPDGVVVVTGDTSPSVCCFKLHG